MPQVSVIIPVYNVEKYLPRCLDALLNQTLKDIEVICINDCSPDGSLNILQEYAKKDERLKVIDLPQNQGAAVARNAGLDIAKGQYLGFVDPDDSIDLDYYEKLYQKAKEGDYDIVKCERETIDLNGQRSLSDQNKLIAQKGLWFFSFEWTTAIYKASIVFDNHIRFPVDCRKAQDVVFLSSFILYAKSYALIDTVRYYYFKRDSSLNAKKIPFESVKSALRAIEHINQNLGWAYTQKNIEEDVYQERFVENIFNASMLFYQTDDVEAKKYSLQAALDMFKNFQKLFEADKYFEKKKNYFIYEFYENNSVDQMYETMSKYPNRELFFRGLMLQSLRKNVKK